MDDQESPTEAPPEIGVYLSGERKGANLVQFSAQNADLQLHERAPLWFGMLVSLSVGDLPSFPGYVRSVEGTSIRIAFQPELHPSVAASVNQTCFDISA